MKSRSIPVLIALYSFALCAQEFRATLSGSVTDQQGAAIAKVSVVATETRTGAKSTAVSEDTGRYTIPFLAPGDYQITVEAPGFKRFVRQGLTLSASERPVIDILLEVGAMSDSVTVSAEAPLVVSTTSAVGQVVTTREVEDIPVNGRAPTMLAALAMGVINTSVDSSFSRPFDSVGGGFSVGGVRGSNEMLVDGVPNNINAAGGSSAYSPPQDAVSEVRVSAFESDAAYGHAGGGTINLVTKSGTNSFHGSASEYNQVSYLEANNFFYNKASKARPTFNYNQYGLTAGGPLYIPKLFNGKNRVFWMFGFEGLRDGAPSEDGVYLATVPTAAERQGDFSALLKVSNAYAIYDPRTGVVSGTQVARTPFPNNVIPTNRLSPVAQKYLDFYPQPSGPGRADGFQNYFVDAVDTNTYDNELGRLDLNVSDKSKLSFQFRNSARSQNKRNYFHNLSTGNYLFRNNHGASLDEVYSISPTVMMNIRANWSRYVNNHGSLSDGFDPTTLGFPTYMKTSSLGLTVPAVRFGGCSVSGSSFPSFQCLGPVTGISNDTVPTDNYQLFGDVIKSWSNHTTKVGADIRNARFSSHVDGNSAGSFVFDSSWTNGPLNNAAASPLGQDFAAFMLGLPSSGTYDQAGYATASSKYFSFFVQDDWRVKTNLTVNLGLRWEHETPTVERYNRVVNGFDPKAVNPISAAAAAAYARSPIAQVPVSQFTALGGLTFASPSNRNVYTSNSSIFSPRFGLAWTPTALGGKTVLRTGFGMFVNPIGIDGLNQPGFSQTTQFVATNDNFLTSANSLSDPFPNGILTASGGNSGTFLGQQVTFYNPQVHNAYSMRWSFSVQQQLPGQLVLELAYIGNHAVHLIGSTQLDYIPRQYLSTSPARDNAVINLLSGSVPNPFRGLIPNSTSLNGSTVALSQLLVPFPQYPAGTGTSNGLIMQGNGFGSSYFHSLNVRLQKRFTHGLTLINNFIWSRLMDQTVLLNDSDFAPLKQVSSISRPLHEIIGGSYELPVGRGKRLNVTSRVGEILAGGWSLSGALTLQSGPPLSFGNVIYNGGPLNWNSHQPDGFAFDINQFNRVSNQQLAQNIRTFPQMFNNLRRDPSRNLDLSLLKRFSFGEQKYLQLRFESFNTMNSVTFGAPNLLPTNTAFGTIGSAANVARRIQTGARLVW